MKSYFNPWHHVEHGHREKDFVNGIVEIPKNCRAKYELDKKSGLLRLDRVLYSSVYYPANYGFIPQTYGDDNDPLDILVLSQTEVNPLCIVSSRILGVLRMLDQGEADDKIIAVAEGDPSVSHFHDVSELPDHTISEMRSFFEDYKKLENKEVTVEEFQGRETAIEILEQCIENYKVKILPSLEDA